jgi:ATP-dependent Clp protease ATP-binding subunit ClpA
MDKSVGVGFNRTETEISKDKAMKGLKEFLRPEFIGRIDEIVVFKPLDKSDFADIAALMLDEMKEPLMEKELTLTYGREVTELIAEKSFGKSYGARDIRRVIREEIEDNVADIIINNGYDAEGIALTVKDGRICADVIKKEK